MDRVLHQSSLIPFIAVFLHAIAVDNGMEDVCLLEDMVAVLGKVSGVSNDCQNLFKVCSAFARLARVLTEARMNSIGSQSQTHGAIQDFDEIDSVPQFVLQPFDDFFGADMVDQLTNHEPYVFSSLLGSWTVDEEFVPGEAPD